MPPLIRRRPLLERLKTQLDPFDFLLWLSEELNDNTYDEVLEAWATPVGIALNLIFIIARGASRNGIPTGGDDVFGDKHSGRGWFSWLSSLIIHVLTLLCCLNAFYSFFRKKHYRLFEQSVDVAPDTPSARRVRVDDSPATNSPLQYLKDAISNATHTQHYPDAEQEVWEVGIWDAKPVNLTLFTLFSPGHLLLYYALLPPTSLDPRPSVTVFLAIVFGIVLSLQLGYMKTSFSQQSKDKALIQGEVLNEYNTKFVHPSLNRLMRDVATQTRESSLSTKGTRTREVDVYTPTVIINRGFSTNPNTNYAGLYSPSSQVADDGRRRRQSNSSVMNTPAPRHTDGGRANGYTQTPVLPSGGTPYTYSSPLKASRDHSRGATNGDDGYFGIKNHAASPIRKSIGSSSKEPGLARAATGRHGLAPDDSRISRRRETGRF